MTQTCMCWGFSCGDGWFDLIDTLCDQIQRHIDHAGVQQVEATQVKEKFGSLNFYYAGGDALIDGMVSTAEAVSERICEECGAPGQLLSSPDGWLMTRCQTHAPKHAVPEAEWLALQQQIADQITST